MSVINISLWRVGLYFIMYQFIMLSLGVGSAISSFSLFVVLSYHKACGVCSIPFVCVFWQVFCFSCLLNDVAVACVDTSKLAHKGLLSFH